MSKLVDEIVAAVRDKKGYDVAVLDLSGVDGAVTDAFVVCSADSTAQVEAIAHNVEEHVRQAAGEKVWRVEGMQNGVWVVMDYVDAMVHIFLREMREFYKLEELWADAPLTKYDD
jgi:ribosome-associated protein